VSSTAIHEGSHCAAAWLLNRDVAYTWIAVGSVQPGEVAGFAMIPITPKLEPSQVVICLIGYMATDTPDWPPSFTEAQREPLEGLGTVLTRLNATEEQYERTVEFTRELLEDPDFIQLRDAIARALARVPRLDSEAIEDLAQIYSPEPEGAVA
jgi:hypothetical protein